VRRERGSEPDVGEPGTKGVPERIGHRGAPREFPENSLAAFRRAFERGADAIELDVHVTADGAVVVHHDPTLTASAGRNAGRAITELTLDQVRGAGLDHDAGVPTLGEVLAVVPREARAYVELKGEGVELGVISALAAADCQYAVHSFDHGAIDRMRHLAPHIPRGILYDKRSIDVVSAMRNIGARDVWPNWRLIDRATVERIHDEGGRVIAWTVNSRRAARSLLALGVDGLCTDDVRLMHDLGDQAEGGG
jgi:glycerophosphoryl diester phosphodiesterase